MVKMNIFDPNLGDIPGDKLEGWPDPRSGPQLSQWRFLQFMSKFTSVVDEDLAYKWGIKRIGFNREKDDLYVMFDAEEDDISWTEKNGWVWTATDDETDHNYHDYARLEASRRQITFESKDELDKFLKEKENKLLVLDEAQEDLFTLIRSQKQIPKVLE
tara:strand:- start:842 stop:1318 length:477 start_codon:yes stop_codon:yes gene_type:complete